MPKPTTTSLLAGALMANSAPHLASAVTGHRQLTPLAGRNSSPAVNGVWGMANLVGGLLLLRRSARAKPGEHWDERLVWFELGAAGFSAWFALTEWIWPSRPRARGRRRR